MAGASLADFVLSAFPDRHLVDVRRQVAAGSVRVNGEECTVATRPLRTGDVVELLVGPPLPRTGGAKASKAASGRNELPAVLFESASTLVIDKPAGLPTVPDRAGVTGIHGLLAELRPDADLRIVHRLDRDTSGCLVLAKGLASAQHFDALFSSGRITKTYVALVHGVPPAAEFAIDAWLGPDRRRPGKVVASPSKRPAYREAHTTVRRRTAFGRHALLELRPATGRAHQLRVHLQSVGHPIAGDTDYGGEPLLLSKLKPGYKLRPGVVERPLTSRMFLHAEQVEFADLDGAPVIVHAPIPADLATALRQLAAHDPPRRPLCD